LGRPDIDNLAKAVIDALVVIRFLRDDCLIHRLVIAKHYADSTPGCGIRIIW
jgi:Holliday junction resolvase RusA-like endonuclease